jgi:hypothetical protein
MALFAMTDFREFLQGEEQLPARGDDQVRRCLSGAHSACRTLHCAEPPGWSCRATPSRRRTSTSKHPTHTHPPTPTHTHARKCVLRFDSDEWACVVVVGAVGVVQSCPFASNSVYYLLQLWSRMVTSVAYLKGNVCVRVCVCVCVHARACSLLFSLSDEQHLL